MSVPDAAIVGRVLAGDAEAFGVLVARYYEPCLRLALHILGERDDAEDVVQDTLLRAYQYLARYEERERFAAWLYRILVNQCRTTIARRKRGAAMIPDWERLALDAEPELAAERRELRETLGRALAQLAPHQREAIVLRFSEDLTYDEMAAITGIGVSALKMRVQRACARLRMLLRETAHV